MYAKMADRFYRNILLDLKRKSMLMLFTHLRERKKNKTLRYSKSAVQLTYALQFWAQIVTTA